MFCTYRTALHYAAERGHDEVVQMLLNTPGVNLNLRDRDVFL